MRETEASHNATIIQTRFQTQCTWLPARNYNLHKNTRLPGAPGSQAASASWGILGPGSPPARDQDLDPQRRNLPSTLHTPTSYNPDLCS